MRVRTIAGIAFVLLVCGYSLHYQEPATPTSPQVRKKVTLTAMLVDFSPSAMVMHLIPVEPSAERLGLKKHQLIKLPIDSDRTRFVSPEGKQISPRDLEPGMCVRLKGELEIEIVNGEAPTEEPVIHTDTVRLVSWKPCLPPARLQGQLIEVDANRCGNAGKLQVGDKVISIELRRKVQLRGGEQWRKEFERHRLLGLRVGMELEVKGYWFDWERATLQEGAAKNEPEKFISDQVLVEEIRIVEEREVR